MSESQTAANSNQCPKITIPPTLLGLIGEGIDEYTPIAAIVKTFNGKGYSVGFEFKRKT